MADRVEVSSRYLEQVSLFYVYSQPVRIRPETHGHTWHTCRIEHAALANWTQWRQREERERERADGRDVLVGMEGFSMGG